MSNLMGKKELYFYYISLITILVLYTNMNHSPNALLRFGFLAALVIPLWDRVKLFPAVIICSLGISMNTFAMPIMPTELLIYVAIAFLFAFHSSSRHHFRTKMNSPFFYAFLYVALSDIVMQASLSNMGIVFLIFLLFYMCLETDDSGIKFIPLSFVIISLAISFWVLLFPEAQIKGDNAVEEMRQTVWKDPNYLSLVLGIGLVIAVIDLIKGENRKKYKKVLIITVVVSTISMLNLASRGALLAVTVAVVSFFVFARNRLFFKFIVVICAVLFLFFLYTNEYMDIVIARIQADDGTGSERTLIWTAKLNEFFFIDNPLKLLFGVGHRGGAELGSGFGMPMMHMSTHNDYLSMLFYYGFVGLTLFLIVVFYPLKVCKRTERPLIFSLLVYIIVGCFTIEPLGRGNFVYWGLFFYVILLARQGHQKELYKSER